MMAAERLNLTVRLDLHGAKRLAEEQREAIIARFERELAERLAEVQRQGAGDGGGLTST
jgi:hypothetical protein